MVASHCPPVKLTLLVNQPSRSLCLLTSLVMPRSGRSRVMFLRVAIAAAVLVACAGPSRPIETMPSDVLAKSDSTVDTSKNPSTSHGGCGNGWFDTCPGDGPEFRPEHLVPFGCLANCSASQGWRGHTLSGLVFLFLLLLLRRRREGSHAEAGCRDRAGLGG